MKAEKENLPICSESDSIKNIIHTITDGKCGLVVAKKTVGLKVITDGDIRRAMEHNEEKFFSLKADQGVILR